MIELRPYQTASIEALYTYFSSNTGNPLIVLPTGAGKSLVLAAFIKQAIDQYPATRMMVLTHVKELIEQDARAIIRYWPQAPIGIWSAGLGQKTKHQVTVAGIQSVHKIPTKFSPIDLVLVDEAHLIPRSADTMYGRFLAGLRQHNAALKVIGLTATPYRMDSGILIEGKDRIFTDIAYEANVADLIKDGYLCPLVAKRGATEADLSGVHVRGGEFVAGELQDAMDKDHLIQGALDEITRLAHDRNHILTFCAGIEHANHVAQAARDRGWAADYVSGEMATGERDAKIQAFKDGKLRMLCNAMLLTTGFDYPSIDCIVMLRPTKSTGLYVQIMGRGLRKDGVKENTLVLDFAGNVQRHGPIDQIKVKRKGGKGEGVSVAPVKVCPDCQELVHTSVVECPSCGYEWARSPAHGTQAADAVIVAALEEPRICEVTRVEYERYEKQGKPPSLKVTYWCGISTYHEWVPIEDDRHFVRKHAVRWFWDRGLTCPDTVEDALAIAEQKLPTPSFITVKLEGKYWRVTRISGPLRPGLATVIRRKTWVQFAEQYA